MIHRSGNPFIHNQHRRQTIRLNSCASRHALICASQRNSFGLWKLKSILRKTFWMSLVTDRFPLPDLTDSRLQLFDMTSGGLRFGLSDCDSEYIFSERLVNPRP